MLQQIVSCSFRRITIYQVKYFSRLKVPQPLPLSKKADNVSFPPPPPRDPLEAQHRDKWTGLIVFGTIVVSSLWLGSYHTNQQIDVLKHRLLETQVALENIIKPIEDESLYDDMLMELRYSEDRPEAVVRDLMMERVINPINTIVNKADETLLMTDRSPLDKEIRAITKYEYLKNVLKKRDQGVMNEEILQADAQDVPSSITTEDEDKTGESMKIYSRSIQRPSSLP